jgi:hypothetical protein
MDYELRSGGELVATLRFRSSWKSFATGESGDGVWTFRRVGCWRPKLVVQRGAQESDNAVLHQKPWKSCGPVTLPDGRTFHATSNAWGTRFGFRTSESPDSIIELKTGGCMHRSAIVTVANRARDLPELPWLVMLAWYSAVLTYQDGVAAAVAAAAGGAAVAGGG